MKSLQTHIYLQGNDIGTITNVPGIFDKGWFEYRLVPIGQTPHGVCVSGSAPIFVEEYNQGPTENDYDNDNSYPFQMAITPVQQFQKELMFCTPGIDANNGFSENDINLVYELDSTGKMPDDMMISIVYKDVDYWQQMNTLYPSGDDILTYLVDSTLQFAIKQIKLPDFGVCK